MSSVHFLGLHHRNLAVVLVVAVAANERGVRFRHAFCPQSGQVNFVLLAFLAFAWPRGCPALSASSGSKSRAREDKDPMFTDPSTHGAKLTLSETCSRLLVLFIAHAVGGTVGRCPHIF